jgi:WD40 repeat protein
MEYSGHQSKNYTVNCKFTEEDSHVLTGSTDGKMFIYDLMKPQPVASISVSTKALSGMDVYEHMAVVGSHDGNIYFSKY